MSELKYSYDSVNFHKTFSPQDSYLAKILELAVNGYSGTKEDISAVTGIPTGKTSGKVVPHILYAYYMGMIKYRLNKGIYSLNVTPLGRIVYDNDKYLFEDISKLICHYHICEPHYGAYIWSFIYTHLPLMLDETISDEALKKKYNEYFDLNVDISPLKNTYSDGFLSVLNLLDFSEGLKINSSYYRDNMLYVYAYLLLTSWEKLFPNAQEITFDQISNELKWNKILGFDDEEMLFTLEQLENEGIVQLNKQLVPYTAVRLTDSSDSMLKLYDLLN